jgi:SAM-dependent methyltransferase
VGVTHTTAEFLAEARRDGVDFGSTLTIGRQASFVGPVGLGALLRRHGVWPEGETRRGFYRRFRDGPPWFIDPYLGALGARDLHALDVSPHEGADIVHDLNEPVPSELEARFDIVLDVGSLEHVFDVPTALRSYMRMVRPGGRLVIVTMANNHCGHGFYQFSPELFYRVMSERNGYAVERMEVATEDVEFSRPVAGLAFPVNPRGGRHAVVDPEDVRDRVLLRTRKGVVVIVQARRSAAVEPLVEPARQQDYDPSSATPWGALDELQEEPPGPVRTAFRRFVPPEARMALALDIGPRLVPLLDPLFWLRAARRRSFRNRRHYRPR